MTREILKAAKSACQSNKDNRKLGSYGLTLMTMLNFGLKDLAEGKAEADVVATMSHGLRLAKTYDNTCCKEKYRHEINKGLLGLAFLAREGVLTERGLEDIKLAVAIHEKQLLSMSAAGFIQTLALADKMKENHV